MARKEGALRTRSEIGNPKIENREYGPGNEPRLVIGPPPPGGVSQVWQAKDLRDAVFGSVANKGVTGEILEVWQGKNLACSCREVRNGLRETGVATRQRSPHGMQRTHMIEAGTPQFVPTQRKYYSRLVKVVKHKSRNQRLEIRS